MLLDFEKHIDKNFAFLKNKKLLIAISGGLDSVVLTHLLHQLNYKISLAHCNFCLRGTASDLDEKFVQNLTKTLDLDLYTTAFDTEVYATKNNLSIQMAARNLRYTWFDELLENKDLDFLLTAHHADDNLETFLINFSRGTGLDGLTGIPAKNNQIVRTLLPFTRNQIALYAKENALLWREDESNAETKYLRNKLRHDIIPLLKEINPNLLESFGNTLANLNASKQIVKTCISNLKEGIEIHDKGLLKYDIAQLKKLNNPQIYLYELLKDYGFTEWNDVTNLLEAQSGKQIFSKTHRLLKDRDFLLLSKNVPSLKDPEKFQIKAMDPKISLPNFDLVFKNLHRQALEPDDLSKKEKQIIYVDKSLLKFPLNVRKWRKGDYFYPLGMQGKKKLSKFFKDEKLSLLEKEKVWVLCADKEVVWVINLRQDNRFKVIKSTKNILKIEIAQ